MQGLPLMDEFHHNIMNLGGNAMPLVLCIHHVSPVLARDWRPPCGSKRWIPHQKGLTPESLALLVSPCCAILTWAQVCSDNLMDDFTCNSKVSKMA